jgi:hypothetical protein
MANLIKVKSNLEDKSKVALWERHKDHPNGEIFIADDKEHQVAETPAVKLALKEEKLVKVGGEFAAAPVKKEDKPK